MNDPEVDLTSAVWDPARRAFILDPEHPVRQCFRLLSFLDEKKFTKAVKSQLTTLIYDRREDLARYFSIWALNINDAKHIYEICIVGPSVVSFFSSQFSLKLIRFRPDNMAVVINTGKQRIMWIARDMTARLAVKTYMDHDQLEDVFMSAPVAQRIIMREDSVQSCRFKLILTLETDDPEWICLKNTSIPEFDVLVRDFGLASDVFSNSLASLNNLEK